MIFSNPLDFSNLDMFPTKIIELGFIDKVLFGAILDSFAPL